MKNKVNACFYGLITISALFNAWLAFRDGNTNATFAWICASGMAIGACGDYVEKINKDRDENPVS